MAPFRILAVLLVTSATSPAWADGPTSTMSEAKKLAELPEVMQVPASVLYRIEVSPAATKTKQAKKHSSTGCNSNGCGYKALLAGLYITKDLQVSDKLSLRVLPTSHSLGGEDAKTPFLVRADARGEDYYGVRVHAKF